MRVLIVKTSSMGDIIHTFPAVTDALAYRSDIAFDWCVETPFADIAALHPGVGEIHRVAMRSWRKTPLSPATWTAFRTVRSAMRECRYDLVIDAQGLLKSAFLAKMASAPVAGYDRHSAREGLSSRFYDHTFAVARNQHAIRRNRLLFAAALGYRPDLARLDNGIVAPTPANPPHGERTAFLLHGTSWDTKKWPVESWIATARALAERGLTPVTTWSSEDERHVAERIAGAVPETVVVPKSSLGAIAGEIGRASLVIGADTGLMHLASAFGLPTIAIFLATKPGLTGPDGPRSRVIEAERKDAGAAIDPGQVLATIDELLGEPKASSAS